MMGFLLAQTEAGTWVGVISAVVNIGFSGAVAVYLLTKAIPEMHMAFKTALETERQHFDKIDDRRHEEHKMALETVVKHCERESDRRDIVLTGEMAIVNKSLADVGEVLEQVRDELRAKRA